MCPPSECSVKKYIYKIKVLMNQEIYFIWFYNSQVYLTQKHVKILSLKLISIVVLQERVAVCDFNVNIEKLSAREEVTTQLAHKCTLLSRIPQRKYKVVHAPQMTLQLQLARETRLANLTRHFRSVWRASIRRCDVMHVLQVRFQTLFRCQAFVAELTSELLGPFRVFTLISLNAFMYF